MGAVAIRDEDCYPFSRSIDNLQRAVVPECADQEIHATEIWSGRRSWARVPQAKRLALLDAVFDHLGSWQSQNRAPIFFGVAIHRASFPGRDLLELAHVQLFRRFDTLLARLHRSGDSHRSVVVADDSSYEKIVQKLVPEWKRKGTDIGRLNSLIEVPFFVDSAASRIVQMADCVAWGIFNYYERGHTKYLQYLHDRFDCDSGVQHGLAHFVQRYSKCLCVPCASKRTRLVASQVTPHPLAPWEGEVHRSSRQADPLPARNPR